MTIKILIADDHQLFIDGLKSILMKEVGISIIGEANNGADVINLINDGLQPDIVLTDIRMPILDGVALTKKLLQKHPKVKILALSMFDQSIDVLEMLQAGAKGYVTKDVEKKELITAIHTLMKGEYYFSKNLPENIREWFNSEVSEPKNPLTRREKEILQLLAKGRTSLEMADHLKISRYTIDTHRKNIHKKLGIKSNTGLVKYALKNL